MIIWIFGSMIDDSNPYYWESLKYDRRSLKALREVVAVACQGPFSCQKNPNPPESFVMVSKPKQTKNLKMHKHAKKRALTNNRRMSNQFLKILNIK